MSTSPERQATVSEEAITTMRPLAGLAVSQVLDQGGGQFTISDYGILEEHAFGSRLEPALRPTFRAAVQKSSLCLAPYATRGLIIGHAPDAAAPEFSMAMQNYTALLEEGLALLWSESERRLPPWMREDRARSTIASYSEVEGKLRTRGDFSLPHLAIFFAQISDNQTAGHVAPLGSGFMVNLHFYPPVETLLPDSLAERQLAAVAIMERLRREPHRNGAYVERLLGAVGIEYGSPLPRNSIAPVLNAVLEMDGISLAKGNRGWSFRWERPAEQQVAHNATIKPALDRSQVVPAATSKSSPEDLEKKIRRALSGRDE